MTFHDFKALPLKKKWEHLWEYYRWPVLVVLLVALFMGSWIHGALQQKDPILQVEMINAYSKAPDGEAFQEFLEQQGIEYYPEAVLVGKNIQMSGPDATANYGAAQMLMCSLSAGEPDLIFWDLPEILPMLNGGTLMDLRELLPPERMEQFEDQLVYGQLEEDSEPYPCGIYLEKNPWIADRLYYANCTVSIPVTCKDKPLAAAFVEYLLSFES